MDDHDSHKERDAEDAKAFDEALAHKRAEQLAESVELVAAYKRGEQPVPRAQVRVPKDSLRW